MLLFALGAFACSSGDQVSAPEAVTLRGFSLTAWGSSYEIFPEFEALQVGSESEAHVHVTALDGFAPLDSGSVEIELRPTGAGEAQRFTAKAPEKPGVFDVSLTPKAAGTFELYFHVRSEAGDESLRAGVVEITDARATGGLRRAPAPKGALSAAEPVSFLKEQQWSTSFGTEWVRPGSLPHSVHGLAVSTSPAGRELILTAPVDGVLLPDPWPFIGQEIASVRAVLKLRPLITDWGSLADLEAELLGLEAQLRVDKADAERQRKLFEQAVASRQAMERAQAVADETAARLAAIAQDLKLARLTRTGESDSDSALETLTLRASSGARVAAIMATPGQVVEAGEELVRMVDASAMWLELALSPHDARSISPASQLLGLAARPANGQTVRFSAQEVGFIARAPEVDRARGTIDVLLSIPSDQRVSLGEALEVDLLIAAPTDFRAGARAPREEAPTETAVVVPTTALIDDGERIVYLQLQGETFVRQPVVVLRSQGDRALVTGLVAGQRVVTRGGNAIRRATLLTGAQSHGHVH